MKTPIIKDLTKVEQVTEFKQGDILCHANNYDNNRFFWFTASKDEVKEYSGKNGIYYRKIIK